MGTKHVERSGATGAIGADHGRRRYSSAAVCQICTLFRKFFRRHGRSYDNGCRVGSSYARVSVDGLKVVWVFSSNYFELGWGVRRQGLDFVDARGAFLSATVIDGIAFHEREQNQRCVYSFV